MKKLVIFDLDGVLLEAREMHYETLNEALRAHGLQVISREDHDTKFNGRPTRTKLVMLGIEHPLVESIMKHKRNLAMGWLATTVNYDNVLMELFDLLHRRDFTIGVASNAQTCFVARALKLLGLWPKVDLMIGGDQVSRPKPDPEMYLSLMKTAEATPETTYIVEDSPIGIEGAERTGAYVMRVNGPADLTVAVWTIIDVVEDEQRRKS